MKTRIRRLTGGIAALCIVGSLAVMVPTAAVYADTGAADPMIMVSLGDSYSAGEGITPFYHTNKSNIEDLIKEYDWLAHRSMNSWPGKLVIPGYEGELKDNTMADYRCDPYYTNVNDPGMSPDCITNNCQWYFAAATGATTHNITGSQRIKVSKADLNDKAEYTGVLPKQLEIFDHIEGTVDYVTITIGGNDAGFSVILDTAAKHSNSLGEAELSIKMDDLWKKEQEFRDDIKDTYKAIRDAAPEADIIVAGYPPLIYPSEENPIPFSPSEAAIINNNVLKFNELIRDVVEECRQEENMKIHFVPVYTEFLGHEAQSSDPWIEGIVPFARNVDLDEREWVSSRSFHPTEKGAEVYAACVNEKIAKIEEEKKAAKEQAESSGKTGEEAGNSGKSGEEAGNSEQGRAVTNEEAISAYKEFLEKNEGDAEAAARRIPGEKSNKKEIHYFYIRDLNGDNIEELITMEIKNGRYEIICIFTLADDGTVASLKFEDRSPAVFNNNHAANGSYNFYICPKRHIHNDYFGGAGQTKVTYIVEDYEVLECLFYEEAYETQDIVCMNVDEEISPDTYEELTSGCNQDEFFWTLNDAEGRASLD